MGSPFRFMASFLMLRLLVEADDGLILLILRPKSGFRDCSSQVFGSSTLSRGAQSLNTYTTCEAIDDEV